MPNQLSHNSQDSSDIILNKDFGFSLQKVNDLTIMSQTYSFGQKWGVRHGQRCGVPESHIIVHLSPEAKGHEKKTADGLHPQQREALALVPEQPAHTIWLPQ